MTREKMTIDEAIAIIRKEYLCVDRDCDIDRSCGKCDLMIPSKEPILEAYKMAIKALEREPCEDAISRQAVSEAISRIGLCKCNTNEIDAVDECLRAVKYLPPVNPIEPCKDAIDRAEAIKIASGYCHPANVAKELAKLPSVNPTKTGHCKDCKWWKDSDGTYCRGIHAESKCPINRKEVYEGNGYCYMFEPQERSGEE